MVPLIQPEGWVMGQRRENVKVQIYFLLESPLEIIRDPLIVRVRSKKSTDKVNFSFFYVPAKLAKVIDVITKIRPLLWCTNPYSKDVINKKRLKYRR